MQQERQPTVYIVTDKKRGTLYIGVTSNPMQRIAQHRTGSLGGFSKRYGLKRLVMFEQFGDMETAIAREKQLKRWRREWKINLIERLNPTWDDLAVGWGFEPLG